MQYGFAPKVRCAMDAMRKYEELVLIYCIRNGTFIGIFCCDVPQRRPAEVSILYFHWMARSELSFLFRYPLLSFVHNHP